MCVTRHINVVGSPVQTFREAKQNNDPLAAPSSGIPHYASRFSVFKKAQCERSRARAFHRTDPVIFSTPNVYEVVAAVFVDFR